MNYTNIDGVRVPVSRIVSGTAQYEDWMREEPLFEVLDAAMEAGINAIDTGREYADGAAERAIGNWLQSRQCREKMVLISKGGHHDDIRKRVTPYDVTADIMDSLELLQTAYIDVYMLHRDDETQPVGPIVEMLNEHFEAGRIHTFGASNWSLRRFQEANAYAKAHGLRPFRVVSQHFSLGEMIGDPFGGGCISLTGESMAADRAWFAQEGIPVFAYSSLCMGVFSDNVREENCEELFAKGVIPEPAYRVYCHEGNFRRLERAGELAAQKQVPLSSIALAYVLHSSQYGQLQTFALVASANRKEVLENAAATDIALTAEEYTWLVNG